jgi:protein phosphatase
MAACLSLKKRTKVRELLVFPMRVTAFGISDVGLQRETNEDTYRILDQYLLYLVADGMGGHQAGDVASKMAADTVVAFFEATQQEDATWPFPIDPQLSLEENRLCSSIKLANKKIYDLSQSDRLLQGMGTTFVGMSLSADGSVSYLAHVGDSRAYRLRGGEMMLMTRDHSLVNDYLNIMPDMPAEAMEVVPRNVITRALGMEDSVVVDIRREHVQPGDRYLLCSDGLSGQVPDERMREILLEHGEDLEAAGKALIKEANDAGGDDNATVILIAVSE